jgi:hypothetical protein
MRKQDCQALNIISPIMDQMCWFISHSRIYCTCQSVPCHLDQQTWLSWPVSLMYILTVSILWKLGHGNIIISCWHVPCILHYWTKSSRSIIWKKNVVLEKLTHVFITDSTRQHTLVSLTLTSFSDSIIIID